MLLTEGKLKERNRNILEQPKPGFIISVKDGQKTTQNVLGEYKVITTEQQFLGVILSFFMHLRWLWLSRFFM